MSVLNNQDFRDVVDFHGCYCLDIAMGYRVANALVREMGDQLKNMKEVVAHVGTNTCGVDAIQKVAGCTFGKRNLYIDDVGKAFYILQNTKSGVAKRAYVHYWDHFDHSDIRKAREAMRASGSAEDKAAFNQVLDANMEKILLADEKDLFSISDVDIPAPEKVGKYQSEPCDSCGEYTKTELLVEDAGKHVCKECGCH